MNWEMPEGFRFAGLHCGIKRDKTREDISLVVADANCVAAGVYTQNRVFAAPVQLDRDRTPSDRIRAIVINSGNANACTGERGLRDAHRMTELVGEAVGVGADQVLVLSTGIIGEHLPLAVIEQGIRAAASRLARDEASVVSAARGMMTTDTRHKVLSRQVTCGAKSYRLFGMAKGAAMIGPNMATMLGVVLTDAPLRKEDARDLLRHAVEDSFNCISVEGHMSTNDTVLLLSLTPDGGAPLSGQDLADFGAGLDEACADLAREIPLDGEGATHLMEIHVTGCPTREQARTIAKAIADSPLVKTAVAGADPNWGRIVSAAGYSGVVFDTQRVVLHVNGQLLFQNGMPVPFDAAAVSASIRDNHTTRIDFQMNQGEASIRFWTCDLTAEYVRLNADYHT
jgi:glutamate N-acetyltransferase/amino-acid N-acetyltransferase